MDEPGFPTSEIMEEFSKMMHRLNFKEDDPNWNICWEMFLQQKSVRLVEQSIQDLGITPEIKTENKQLETKKSEKKSTNHAEFSSNSSKSVLTPQVQALFSIPLATPQFCTPKLNPNIPSFVPATAPPSSVTVLSANSVKPTPIYNQPTLIILRGIPGSGKTHLANLLIAHSQLKTENTSICSADDYFVNKRTNKYDYDRTKISEVHAKCLDKAKNAVVSRKMLVVVDNTNCSTEDMRPYIVLGLEHGYQVLFKEPETKWKYKVRDCFKKCLHDVPKKNIDIKLDRLGFHCIQDAEQYLEKIKGEMDKKNGNRIRKEARDLKKLEGLEKTQKIDLDFIKKSFESATENALENDPEKNMMSTLLGVDIADVDKIPDKPKEEKPKLSDRVVTVKKPLAPIYYDLNKAEQIIQSENVKDYKWESYINNLESDNFAHSEIPIAPDIYSSQESIENFEENTPENPEMYPNQTYQNEHFENPDHQTQNSSTTNSTFQYPSETSKTPVSEGENIMIELTDRSMTHLLQTVNENTGFAEFTNHKNHLNSFHIPQHLANQIYQHWADQARNLKNDAVNNTQIENLWNESVTHVSSGFETIPEYQQNRRESTAGGLKKIMEEEQKAKDSLVTQTSYLNGKRKSTIAYKLRKEQLIKTFDGRISSEAVMEIYDKSISAKKDCGMSDIYYFVMKYLGETEGDITRDLAETNRQIWANANTIKVDEKDIGIIELALSGEETAFSENDNEKVPLSYIQAREDQNRNKGMVKYYQDKLKTLKSGTTTESGGVISYYATEKRSYDRLAKEAGNRAVAILLSSRNAKFGVDRLDLHGLNENEAKMVVKNKLSARHITFMRGKGYTQVKIITGHGRNTMGSFGVLKKMVVSYLSNPKSQWKDRYKQDGGNDGSFTVSLNAGVN